MTRIPVAIVGATGYAGETALRILLNHPNFSVVHVGSDRLAGTRLAEAVPSFAHETDLVLAPDTIEAVRESRAKAVILAKKSPDVTRMVPDLLSHDIKIIDIGAEFRLNTHEAYQKWYGSGHECPNLLALSVYGLTEIYRDQIAAANLVGNPGCYPTSILLPLVPLLRGKLLDLSAPLVSASYSGISGAGKKFIESNNNLFYALNENLRSYKQVGHQHTGEIDQELSAAAGGAVHCSFVPHLAPITRGIHSTVTATMDIGVHLDQVHAAWNKAYAGRPFVRVRTSPNQVEVSGVTGTNFCDFAAVADGSTLIVTSVLDNLVKGASGQAVQNLNLMFGLPETAGLLHRGL